MRRESDVAIDPLASIGHDLLTSELPNPQPPKYSPREPHKFNWFENTTLVVSLGAFTGAGAGILTHHPEWFLGGFAIAAVSTLALCGSIVVRDGLDRVEERARRFWLE